MRSTYTCPCGVQFHACSNCGLSNSWKYEYCSESCWRDSEEYIKWRAKFESLYEPLDTDQRDNLMDMLTEMDSDYINELYNWIRIYHENIAFNLEVCDGQTS